MRRERRRGEEKKAERRGETLEVRLQNSVGSLKEETLILFSL